LSLIVGQGSGRGGGLILGHFAAERWQRAHEREASYVHEVLIGGEGLQHGAADVLATLLHEAAHAIANVRQIKDTSRQGRYHNTRYKRLAQELGLTVERDEQIGCSLTTLPHRTAKHYAPTIRQLDRAITLHRRSEDQGGDAPAEPTSLPPSATAHGASAWHPAHSPPDRSSARSARNHSRSPSPSADDKPDGPATLTGPPGRRRLDRRRGALRACACARLGAVLQLDAVDLERYPLDALAAGPLRVQAA
jgi:hypothetical protein